MNRISRIDLFSPRRSATVPLREPDLVVERAKVVQLLAEKAIQAGAEIRAGCEFVGFTPIEDGAWVTVRDTKRGRTEQVKTRTLIGADGAFSRVAKTAERDGRGLAPLEIQAARIPIYAPAPCPWRRLAGCDIYLVADAAG